MKGLSFFFRGYLFFVCSLLGVCLVMLLLFSIYRLLRKLIDCKFLFLLIFIQQFLICFEDFFLNLILFCLEHLIFLLKFLLDLTLFPRIRLLIGLSRFFHDHLIFFPFHLNFFPFPLNPFFCLLTYFLLPEILQ